MRVYGTKNTLHVDYDAPGHPDQYYCRADHYSYARYGVPSVSLSRGEHRDYHQVTDEPQYINYPDYARLTQMVFDAAALTDPIAHLSHFGSPTDMPWFGATELPVEFGMGHSAYYDVDRPTLAAMGEVVAGVRAP